MRLGYEAFRPGRLGRVEAECSLALPPVSLGILIFWETTRFLPSIVKFLSVGER
jgi:hypothetical protein